MISMLSLIQDLYIEKRLDFNGTVVNVDPVRAYRSNIRCMKPDYGIVDIVDEKRRIEREKDMFHMKKENLFWVVYRREIIRNILKMI